MRVRSRHYSRALALLATAAVAGCIEIKDGGSSTAAADSVAADSAAGVVGVPATPPNMGSGTASFGPDIATPIRGNPLGTPEALAALQSDTMETLSWLDTMPAVRSPTPGAAPATPPAVTPAATPPIAPARGGAPDAAAGALAPGGLMLPVAGMQREDLRDTYTERRGGGTRTHEALDIPAARGTPVLSVTGGRVLKLFDSKAGGKMVYATDSTERFIFMYAHLDSYAPGLAEGQPLRRGQQVGTVGTSGNAPPNLPHLHFAIARSNDVKQWWKGEPVNPYTMLAR